MGGCGAGHTENSGATVGQIRQLIKDTSLSEKMNMTEKDLLLLIIRVMELEKRVKELEDLR